MSDTLTIIAGRVTPQMKEDFSHRCDDLGVKPSLVMRLLISEWLGGNVQLSLTPTRTNEDK